MINIDSPQKFDLTDLKRKSSFDHESVKFFDNCEQKTIRIELSGDQIRKSFLEANFPGIRNISDTAGTRFDETAIVLNQKLTTFQQRNVSDYRDF